MVPMTVILLKILNGEKGNVKNHMSQSKTSEFQCNQTVNLKTDSRTLYYSILKLKYSPSTKGQQKLKDICIVEQHQE